MSNQSFPPGYSVAYVEKFIKRLCLHISGGGDVQYSYGFPKTDPDLSDIPYNLAIALSPVSEESDEEYEWSSLSVSVPEILQLLSPLPSGEAVSCVYEYDEEGVPRLSIVGRYQDDSVLLQIYLSPELPTEDWS